MTSLYKLANAPADILSDIPLIEGLESTKATAGEIASGSQGQGDGDRD